MEKISGELAMAKQAVQLERVASLEQQLRARCVTLLAGDVEWCGTILFRLIDAGPGLEQQLRARSVAMLPYLVVDFHARDTEAKLHVVGVRDELEDFVDRQRDDARVCPFAHHRVRFARGRLPVREDCAVNTFHRGQHNGLGRVVVDLACFAPRVADVVCTRTRGAWPCRAIKAW